MTGNPFQKREMVVCSVILLIMSLVFHSCGKQQQYNLIYISLDTTRFDFVNTGKGARANTPELKRFSRTAVVMERAYATIPQTLPSHLSILTSRFPHELGVLANENEYDGRFKMLQEVLNERGYHTAGVISLGSISGKTGISRGFDVYNESLFTPNRFYVKGDLISNTAADMLDKIKDKPFFMFVHYSDPHSPYGTPDMRSEFNIRLNGRIVRNFNAYEGSLLRLEIPLTKGWHTLDFSTDMPENDYNFFIIRRLVLNKNCSIKSTNIEYSKRHYEGSYLLRKPRGRLTVYCQGDGLITLFQIIPILSKEAAVTCYSGEVEFLDRQVGKFLHHLEKRALLDKTIIAIFADHGEGLGERDAYFGHVRYLNQQFIHVPLMIRFPGVSRKRIQKPVSLIGITPTVLDFMGITDHGIRNTENWTPLIRKRNASWNRPVLSFAFQPSSVTDKLSVIQWPFQAIYAPASHKSPAREFYNLNISQSFSRFDRIEKNVMITSSSKQYRYLINETRNHKQIFLKKHPLVMVNAGCIENLKALGYIK
jgi:hypothetical protein